MTDEPFSVEVTISAPVGEVWNALRDPEQIRRWHGWHFDGLDKEIEAIYRQDVVESAAEHRLEVQGGDRFELADLGGRTRLRITRAPRGGNPDWDAYYDDISEGWVTFAHQLRFALERHPGADRRTVFLSGRASTPVLQAAGLAAVAGLPAGSPYELAAPTGETLTGEVWFRSARQLGLTVDGWGDGLLVAAQNPVSPAAPGGAAMMVLTAYGLGNEEFAALEARWNAWWERHFPAEPDGQAG
ncbi:SRPBCC domain-containing protein [Planomonospora sp. ID67723]|uniref:SRPBCC family protein n=1 Tax=Planomonospora sp. ID67723 TaxID=2738134 RepID=UPI0018C35534|nr:SRPBCC domain-containing protein [Planomonospora sp. ID67723]MBG0829384.1 SRPBCC domain-containing protein [Planomonospora sp. ID67723]